MERARYLDLLRSDGAAMHAAAGDVAAPVPTCPGWTVADALNHTAEVYEHKIAAIEGRGTKPDPWPPQWPAGRDPREWFADAHARIVALLEKTDPADPSWTWWPDDQTAGFWVRRMAQETAVHRVDVQSAYGAPGPVDADLAVDGVDEVLVMMLSGDWSSLPQPDLNGTVAVATGGRTWRVAMMPEEVTVEESDGDAEATVSGEPGDVLLWLWGRAGDERVTFGGDRDAARRFRERLALATQ
jgi:uncharacterized protein (TIGR03083 family)